MIINLNAVLCLQVRRVQSHRPLKMSTLVSSHFLWEKFFAKKKNWLNHNGCDILSVMVKKARHHIMDVKVFASRDMTEAMSLND